VLLGNIHSPCHWWSLSVAIHCQWKESEQARGTYPLRPHRGEGEAAKTQKEHNPSEEYYPLETAKGGMSRDIEGRCRVRGTHGLGTAKEETSQERERNRTNEGRSPLGTAEGRTCQDTERKQSSEGHPLETAEGGTSQDIKRKKRASALTSWIL